MIYMNIEDHDEIWDYECMYEVGLLMWYLVLNKVREFYSLHCTSIAWVLYMSGLYHVALDYVYYFMCILDLLGKNIFWLKCPFKHGLMIFMHKSYI